MSDYEDMDTERPRTPEETKKKKSGVKGEQQLRSDVVILRGIFKLGKKSHDVILSRTTLSWTPIGPEDPRGEVCVGPSGQLVLRDVFAVKVKRRRTAEQSSGGAVLGLALFWARRQGPQLKEDSLHLHNASTEHIYHWYNTIKEALTDLRRPSFVKVFINPSSHRKEAVHVYREHVAPLFKMAGLHTDMTVTEKKGHALSVIKECKLEQYDGVVVVGGDGSVAEVCHALVLRAQLDSDSPLDSPERVTLPLGIIPAGSTDVVSCSVHGVRDPVTAALHVILGHVQEVDMCSFWSRRCLVRYGFSAMFGFGGRSLARAEKKRWMPSSQRRDYAVVRTLAKLRPEDCQLSFQRANKPNRNPFGDPSDQSEDPDSDQTEEEESWTTNEGLYLSISVMSIPCLSPHTPRGLAPNTRLANGSAALIAVGNAPRTQFIKHLKRYSASSGQFSFPFVEAHVVSAVKIRPRTATVIGSEEENEDDAIQSENSTLPIIESESSTDPVTQSESGTFPWNIDGELVELAHEVLIRVHPRLMCLYGEEVEQAESSASCGCI